MLKRLLLAVAVMGLTTGLAARADFVGQTLSFTLTQDGCSHGCGTTTVKTFGTIVLTYNGSGVNVVETLTGGSQFVESAGDSLGFDVSGGPLTITGLTTGFTVVGGTDTAGTWTVASGSNKEPPFGQNYEYAVTCGGTSCGPGSSTENPGPLDFTIEGVTLEDFSGSTSTMYGDVFFSSDIIGPSGNTGDVGADGPGTPGGTPPVPEPSSLALLGTGALGMAGVLRRKFRRS